MRWIQLHLMPNNHQEFLLVNYHPKHLYQQHTYYDDEKVNQFVYEKEEKAILLTQDMDVCESSDNMLNDGSGFDINMLNDTLK